MLKQLTIADVANCNNLPEAGNVAIIRNTSIFILKLSPSNSNLYGHLLSLTSSKIAGPSASHQISRTGLVAKIIQLYGLLDPKRFLEAGIKAGFLQDTRGEKR
jgi:hypothetical protein